MSKSDNGEFKTAEAKDDKVKPVGTKSEYFLPMSAWGKSPLEKNPRISYKSVDRTHSSMPGLNPVNKILPVRRSVFEAGLAADAAIAERGQFRVPKFKSPPPGLAASQVRVLGKRDDDGFVTASQKLGKFPVRLQTPFARGIQFRDRDAIILSNKKTLRRYNQNSFENDWMSSKDRPQVVPHLWKSQRRNRQYQNQNQYQYQNQYQNQNPPRWDEEKYKQQWDNENEKRWDNERDRQKMEWEQKFIPLYSPTPRTNVLKDEYRRKHDKYNRRVTKKHKKGNMITRKFKKLKRALGFNVSVTK